MQALPWAICCFPERLALHFFLYLSCPSLLGAAGIVLLWAATNMLCVFIVAGGFWIYVGAYGLWLKRCSVYGTLIGSLAGAAPALAGYCAAGNRFDTGAVILLLIFGLWQIPHSYAIALFRFRDYAAASLPVLPVKRGMPAARRHILGYILGFVAATPLLTCSGYTGYSYLAVVAATGLCWLHMAWSGHPTSNNRLWAKRLYVFSIVTVTVMSVMMSIDAAAPGSANMCTSGAP